MSDNNNNQEIMTIQDVSVYLKLAKSTVYRLARNGELPGRRVGGRWRFLRSEIELWLKGKNPEA